MNALLSNPFKRGLLRGETQIGLWLSSTSSYMAEIAATSGYDWLLIDGEHAPNTIQDLYHQLQAIAPMQPAGHSPGRGQPQPDKTGAGYWRQNLAGADGRYRRAGSGGGLSDPLSPIGSRGVGAGVARAARWGRVENYMAEANDELCLLIQVESRTALENPDAILEVDGIDGVFIGPADLSASLGYPDDAGHPDVQRVIEQSIRRIRAAGKRPDFWRSTRRWRKMSCGANFVAVGVDTMLYTRRWTAGWRCLNLTAPSRKRKRAIEHRLALGSDERLRQHRQRMLAAFAGGHLNLPFAGLAVGDDEVGPALLNLTEQRGADSRDTA